MIELMLQKILHKKWMIISLLIGNILLIAIAIANPMYRDASLTSLLQEEFNTYIEKNNTNPAVLDLYSLTRKGEDNSAEYANMENRAKNIAKDLGIDALAQVTHHNLVSTTANSMMHRTDRTSELKVKIGSLSDLENHAQVVSGAMYSNELDSEGRIEVVVTMTGFVNMGLLIGEEYEFPYFKSKDGTPYHAVIVGVVTNSDSTDSYWINSPDTYASEVFMAENLFEELVIDSKVSYNYDTHWYTEIDYTTLRYSDVHNITSTLSQLSSKRGNINSGVESSVFVNLLKNYTAKEQRISITLTILMVPVLVLLCAFLSMISRQLFDMEESEISLLKSRGASKKQIRQLYFLQSLFLTGVSVVIGVPLGALITMAIGSASAFLEFSGRRALTIAFTWEEVFFTLGAVVISILMTVLPAIRQSKVSIVKQKQSRARASKPFWQKFFLDIVMIAASGYGFYNFYRTKDSLVTDVMAGKSLDPLLFLSSSLFILGCSLLCLRIIPAIAKLVYAIRKKHMQPATYASFLEIIRSGQKRYFIMTFLMLTVALGIFNTTVARTIESNATKNQTYLTGADLCVQEYWPNNFLYTQINPDVPLTYTEPDFGKYGTIEGVSSMAQVYVDNNGSFSSEGQNYSTMIYGIRPKDFGLTTVDSIPNDIFEEHYYTYLNAMAISTDFVLVSTSFRDKLGYNIGDTIAFTSHDAQITAIIADFVDYFPGYEPTTYITNPDGEVVIREQYLVVGHLSTIQKEVGIRPYEVWINFENNNTDAFYQFVQDYDVSLTSVTDLTDTLTEIREEPLFEGTNGILTMSFIIVLILCLVGYLIYWILSIRSRELLFGIFRAMGMSRGEIIHMLILEQVFASILPILFGTGIGIGASKLFVPIIQIAYSSSDQVLPLSLITQPSDMIRLFAVILMMLIIGIVVLVRQILKMKLNEALKLGED